MLTPARCLRGGAIQCRVDIVDYAHIDIFTVIACFFDVEFYALRDIAARYVISLLLPLLMPLLPATLLPVAPPGCAIAFFATPLRWFAPLR